MLLFDLCASNEAGCPFCCLGGVNDEVNRLVVLRMYFLSEVDLFYCLVVLVELFCVVIKLQICVAEVINKLMMCIAMFCVDVLDKMISFQHLIMFIVSLSLILIVPF